ncbi:exodeoxyribonuclease VII small subunit [Roseospira visakhapatnamensis]|uniref:Exodeoxyribonuclease 7 small subunit n=1 Tax=Roseospira visakhapatnamensis TaxID=390880 RepID=A0A7W6W8J2_9PROT|nr:exodeoxyribonuclease VII small subunit [Roseospira visakhapatnamensis]MBB4265070.1 exodeoxyribonuclease VII small subunit [Roseospira visakhapatnamensis]
MTSKPQTQTVSPGSPAAGATPPADIAALSFEQAMAALEDIVQQLESGRVDLDAAVTAYERGVWLRRHCEARLSEARAKVERIGVTAGGSVETTPLDVG